MQQRDELHIIDQNSNTFTTRSLQALLTRTDLEKVLKLSGRTIRKLITCGGLPQPIRIGLSYRWRAEDIDQFIATQTTVGCVSDTRGGHAATSNLVERT